MAPPHLIIYVYIYISYGSRWCGCLKVTWESYPTVRVGDVSNMNINNNLPLHSNNRCMMWVCDGIKPSVGIKFDPLVFLWLWSDTLYVSVLCSYQIILDVFEGKINTLKMMIIRCDGAHLF